MCIAQISHCDEKCSNQRCQSCSGQIDARHWDGVEGMPRNQPLASRGSALLQVPVVLAPGGFPSLLLGGKEEGALVCRSEAVGSTSVGVTFSSLPPFPPLSVAGLHQDPEKWNPNLGPPDQEEAALGQ